MLDQLHLVHIPNVFFENRKTRNTYIFVIKLG